MRYDNVVDLTLKRERFIELYMEYQMLNKLDDIKEDFK